MNMDKKGMISFIAITVVCIASGLVSAIVAKWNLISIILLCVIVGLSIFINVAFWAEVSKENKEKIENNNIESLKEEK